MKLKIYTLLFFFSFSFFSSTFAALDIKKKDNVEISQDKEKQSDIKNNNHNTRWYHKSRKRKAKTKRFSFKKLFKWKKKKNENQKQTAKKAIWSLLIPLFSFLTLLIGGELGVTIFISLKIISLFLGVFALVEISAKPDELKGKVIAWIGIILSIAWLIFLKIITDSLVGF